jgi:serine/threonine-protein kinase
MAEPRRRPSTLENLRRVILSLVAPRVAAPPPEDLAPEIEVVIEDLDRVVDDDDEPERRIGRYSLLEPLGSGGSAHVFLARASGPGGFTKRVALKVLRRELAGESDMVTQLMAEARLAAELSHPNIVQTLDLGVGDDCYIAMEYVDGADLKRLVEVSRRRRERPPLAVALHIVRSVCEGLHAAHTAVDASGFPLCAAHRDVKLANILISRHGAVKVGDFGIALMRATHFLPSRFDQAKGTPQYMPPEQLATQTVDARADVYGVGAVAYQLFTGHRIDLDPLRLRGLGREGWPHLPPMRQLCPELPHELDEIVRYALAYSPDERFASCAALARALATVATRYRLAASEPEVAAWAAPLLRFDLDLLPPVQQEALPRLPPR